MRHKSYCNYPNDPCCCEVESEREQYFNSSWEKGNEILERISKRKKEYQKENLEVNDG